MFSPAEIQKIRDLIFSRDSHTVQQGLEFVDIMAFSTADIVTIVGRPIPQSYKEWREVLLYSRYCQQTTLYHVWLLGKLAEFEEPWVKSLKKVDLRSLGLSFLPKSLFALTDIVSLDVRGNPLEELPDNLQALRVDRAQWDKFSLEIFTIHSLRYLHLPHLNIDSLPEEIGNLTHLEFLNIQKNKY